MKFKEKFKKETGIILADPTIFNLFDIQLIRGTPETVLDGSQKAIISDLEEFFEDHGLKLGRGPRNSIYLPPGISVHIHGAKIEVCRIHAKPKQEIFIPLADPRYREKALAAAIQMRRLSPQHGMSNANVARWRNWQPRKLEGLMDFGP